MKQTLGELRFQGLADGAHGSTSCACQPLVSQEGLMCLILVLSLLVVALLTWLYSSRHKKEGRRASVESEQEPADVDLGSSAQPSPQLSPRPSDPATPTSLGTRRRKTLRRNDLLELLLEQSNKELVYILQSVAVNRGAKLLEEAAKLANESSPMHRTPSSASMFHVPSLKIAAGTGEPPSAGEPTTEAGRRGDRLTSLSNEAVGLVQFSSFQYYQEEGQDLTLRVLRTGVTSVRTVVSYQSKDSSAKAGVHYKSLNGELVFEPGEWEKEIYVELMQNESFGLCTGFKVELTAVENAIIGEDLYQAWVDIMDDDFFPTNKYRTEIDPERLVREHQEVMSKVNKMQLLIEYMKFCADDQIIFVGMLKMVLVDQFENLHNFINLLMSVYLVDFVVVSSVPLSKLFLVHDRTLTLVIITAVMVLPLSVLHVLNHLRNYWGVSGAARTALQTALLRKFLDYSDDVRSVVGHGDIILATTNDAETVVSKGLMQMLSFFKLLGSLFMLLTFQFVAPQIFDRPFRAWLVGCVLVVPLLMAFIANLRFTIVQSSLTRKHELEVGLGSFVYETVVSYPMIADYNQRPAFVEKYEQLIMKNNAANSQVESVLTNNRYMASWITTLAVAAFTFFGGIQVIKGFMTLGMYLANVKIFRDTGDTCQEVYDAWLELQEVLPPLTRITRLLNLPIDIDERKEIMDFRESSSIAKLAQDKYMSMNKMAIALHDIEIKFHSIDRPVNFPGSVSINQGTLVTVVGPRGSGKATLLKVLGGAILPDVVEGLFIPSHLRVLHVQVRPMFFSGQTLMDNLIFGSVDSDKEEVKKRAKKICQRLKVSEDVLECLERQDVLPWASVLSETQKMLMSLARAFVASPHVLLLHRPTELFDEAQRNVILELLREFVDKRGVERDDSTFVSTLRPLTTCIMTTASKTCVKVADQVICIDPKEGLRAVQKSSIKEGMLG